MFTEGQQAQRTKSKHTNRQQPLSEEPVYRVQERRNKWGVGTERVYTGLSSHESPTSEAASLAPRGQRTKKGE